MSPEQLEELLRALKEHKPESNAIDVAAAMGIELLTATHIK